MSRSRNIPCDYPITVETVTHDQPANRWTSSHRSAYVPDQIQYAPDQNFTTTATLYLHTEVYTYRLVQIESIECNHTRMNEHTNTHTSTRTHSHRVHHTQTHTLHTQTRCLQTHNQ